MADLYICAFFYPHRQLLYLKIHLLVFIEIHDEHIEARTTTCTINKS